jgi:hypothetical protein
VIAATCEAGVVTDEGGKVDVVLVVVVVIVVFVGAAE